MPRCYAATPRYRGPLRPSTKATIASLMESQFSVTCPYCGEEVEIYLEPEVRGTLVQDCEVCCNPWQLRISTDGDERYVEVTRADGSE